MNPYLRHAQMWFALSFAIALIWMCSGCAANNATVPVCRHYATMGAIVDAEAGYPVRVWWGESSVPEGHNQHQAWIDDIWQWRCVGINSVYTCKQDNFTPVKAIDFKTWMRGVTAKATEGK